MDDTSIQQRSVQLPHSPRASLLTISRWHLKQPRILPDGFSVNQLRRFIENFCWLQHSSVHDEPIRREFLLAPAQQRARRRRRSLDFHRALYPRMELGQVLNFGKPKTFTQAKLATHGFFSPRLVAGLWVLCGRARVSQQIATTAHLRLQQSPYRNRSFDTPCYP
jgi:hypothetical protein